MIQALVIVFVLLASQVSAQTLVFRETFTEGANPPNAPPCYKPLQDHVPDFGGFWQLIVAQPSYAQLKVGQQQDWGSFCSNTSGDKSLYFAQIAGLSANYTLQVTLRDAVKNTINHGGLVVRGASPCDFYAFGMRSYLDGGTIAEPKNTKPYNWDADIFKYVNCQPTLLDTKNLDILVDNRIPTTELLKFRVSGQQLSVIYRGQVVLSATDADIPYGMPGIFGGAFLHYADKTPSMIGLDDFEVYDEGSDPDPDPDPDPVPVLTPVESWVLPTGVLRFCTSDGRCWGDVPAVP